MGETHGKVYAGADFTYLQLPLGNAIVEPRGVGLSNAQLTFRRLNVDGLVAPITGYRSENKFQFICVKISRTTYRPDKCADTIILSKCDKSMLTCRERCF